MLTRPQWRSYLVLQVLFALTALIQVAGIASLAPFVALVANHEMIHNNPITAYIYELFAFNSDNAFLIFFALGVMAFIVVSNAIAAATTWYTFHFTQNLGLELQSTIYKNYIYKDYTFFSKTNSSRLIAIITQEAPRFTYMVMQPILNLISQLFTVVIIAAGLMYMDPVLSLVAILIIGGGYLGVFRFVKQSLTYHGDKIFWTATAKFKMLNESLGGIKEIKLLATERRYESRVDEINKIIAKSNAMIGVLGDLPRFIIETLAFCALLSLAIYLLIRQGDSTTIISTLSLYAMAGYRLLPAAQTIFKSASQIKANSSVLNELYPAVMEGRSATRPDDNIDTSATIAPGDIELNNVSYRYPDASGLALVNVNLRIRKNSIVAFVGSSGAGKSTLADLLLGFLSPTKGEMRVGGELITPANVRLWQRHLGYVPQNIFLIDDTIAANVAFGNVETTPDQRKVQAAIKAANLENFVDGLPEKTDFIVGEHGSLLSGGQKQRVGIARALYHDAEYLIMDEATSALDNLTEKEIIKTITQLKASKTIVMIAHRLSTIRNADQIVFFDNGSINDVGTFDELNARNAEFRIMAQTIPESVVHS